MIYSNINLINLIQIDRNGNLIEEINKELINKKDQVITKILPNLVSNFEQLNLENMNKNSFLKYNNTLGLIIHRLLLVYIAIIRIYGNRIQSVKSKIKMDQMISKSILNLVLSLSNIKDKNLEEIFSSHEKLIECFEIDILSYFKNEWNYSSFHLTEEFFIDIYKDYILILNENYSESTKNISYLFLALSDIYFTFKSCNQISILKKLKFYIAWCKQYSSTDSFRIMLNFLQFRSEYHKKIISNLQFLSFEQIQEMKPKNNQFNQSNQSNLNNLFDQIKKIHL